ncbi:integrase [Streptomyces sp. DSM 42143]|uniref:integrase n=1 Tax=Streptomyces sp. DSM 42143 TaxID=2817711 RepID=UPI002782BEA7|nr:integrase [Streptomyces sp. DSM 42143]MDQ0390136.1 integrase [Streptomyces sp. DSM 42143]
MTTATDHSSEEADRPPVPTERDPIVVQWARRHGVEVAQRLADAEDFADEVRRRLRPANTTDTYAKAWRVWRRFCEAQGFPELEATRGALVAFVVWLLDRGRVDGKGYAPSSASTILAGAVVELRRRGAEVSRDDQGQARTTLEAAAVELLKAGERRGRGQAVAAEVPDLYRVARACPDTLAGARDKALVLTGFHYASRAQDPAGLLAGDVALTPRGLVVSVLTGKTRHSVRDAKINYQRDPAVCPVEAWKAYRNRLAAEAEPRWSEPDAPAFVGIDRHGNVSGGMVPDSVTRAVKRISVRAGVPLAWTGHSLRIGLATTARKRGKDAVAIADQGGWARHSRSMNGYFQRVDGWEDNATAGLT